MRYYWLMSDLLDLPVTTLAGGETTFGELVGGKVALVVNVASNCGFTPQYKGLQNLHSSFADRGFTVVGFPCNQFMGQEPGTNEEIAEFCSSTYGVTFPMSVKIDVNGENRDPIYATLIAAGGVDKIRWNFEKFLVVPDGNVLGRFHPRVEPDNPKLLAAVESVLAS
jgi:glutathione peroxidase